MAISKVILNGDTLIDVTQKTVASENLLSGETALGADGEDVVGAYVVQTFSTQSKTATPTESSQSIFPDTGYDGLSEVTINPISSAYVGSAIPRKSSADLTVSGSTITAPIGYYSSAATKNVASGTAGTPTAAKGTVTNHSVSITPSVTNTTGYITGGTKTGTAVTVTASELASGSKNITENASNIDVVGYSKVNVSVNPSLQDKSISFTPSETAQSQTVTKDSGYYGLDEVTVSVDAVSQYYVGSGVPVHDENDISLGGTARLGKKVQIPSGVYNNDIDFPLDGGTAATPNTSITAYPTISVSSNGLITATNSASQSVTPTTTEGWIFDGTGTAGTITVNGSSVEQLTTQSGKTITPSESEQTAVNASIFTTGAIKVAAISSTYVGTGVSTKSSADLLFAGGTFTAPAGYYSSTAHKNINVSTLPTPAISFSTATGLFTATNNLAIDSFIPSSVTSITSQLSTIGATTYTPRGTSQTISSGYYLTGVQTIAGDTNLKASNIASGVSIFGVTGTFQGGVDSFYQSAYLRQISNLSLSTSSISVRNGAFAFAYNGVTDLKTVDLPNHSIIGQGAFYYCKSLSSVNIPNLELIREKTFGYCQSLLSVEFPKCTNVAQDAFVNDVKLTTASFASCTSIGTSAFQGCTSLSNIYFPECSHISSHAFEGCWNLSIASFPKCSVIKESVFWSAYRLNELYFPECTSIGTEAFYNCSRISSYNFDSVTYISPRAFINAQPSNGLWSFPACTNIGEQAFIKVSMIAAPSLTISINSYITGLYFPECTAIGSSAFYYLTSITSIDFPKCNIIYQSAFYSCSSLRSANFPNVKSISTAAFKNCSSLSIFINGSALSSIGNEAFYATRIISFSASSVTYIPYAAFQHCYSLVYIDFPNVTSINTYAFCNAKLNSFVNLPKCETIEQYAFASTAISLASFSLCTRLGQSVFYNATSLDTINFPILESTSTGAFAQCINLINVSLPSCAIIAGGTFSNCYKLSSINLPACTEISANAFRSCSTLSVISISNCISIGTSAFFNCPKLRSVYLTNVSMVTVLGSTASNIFNSTPMTNSSYIGTYGSIFVPASLYNDFITDTKWSVISSRIVSV